MKISGRYGTFTPRPDQAAYYAKRAKAQKAKRADVQRSLAEHLAMHRTCANGCGRAVAFYDTVHYCLKYGGCCSAECEAELRKRQDEEWAAASAKEVDRG
jgi:hypothetical protein